MLQVFYSLRGRWSQKVTQLTEERPIAYTIDFEWNFSPSFFSPQCLVILQSLLGSSVPEKHHSARLSHVKKAFLAYRKILKFPKLQILSGVLTSQFYLQTTKIPIPKLPNMHEVTSTSCDSKWEGGNLPKMTPPESQLFRDFKSLCQSPT